MMNATRMETTYDGERVRINEKLGTVTSGWKYGELTGVVVLMDEGHDEKYVMINQHIEWIAGDEREGIRTLCPPLAIMPPLVGGA